MASAHTDFSSRGPILKMWKPRSPRVKIRLKQIPVLSDTGWATRSLILQLLLFWPTCDPSDGPVDPPSRLPSSMRTQAVANEVDAGGRVTKGRLLGRKTSSRCFHIRERWIWKGTSEHLSFRKTHSSPQSNFPNFFSYNRKWWWF